MVWCTLLQAGVMQRRLEVPSLRRADVRRGCARNHRHHRWAPAASATGRSRGEARFHRRPVGRTLEDYKVQLAASCAFSFGGISLEASS